MTGSEVSRVNNAEQYGFCVIKRTLNLFINSEYIHIHFTGSPADATLTCRQVILNKFFLRFNFAISQT